MTPEQKELFRLAILRVLDTNRTRYGVGVKAIALRLLPSAFSAKDFKDAEEFHDAIADELQYLADKHFVEETLKPVSAENRAWRIRPEGIALVDKN